MKLGHALTLQKKISDQFLFNRKQVPVVAGGLDDEPSPGEMVYQIFDEIFGVGIAGNVKDGYYIELVSENEELYMTPIRSYFNASNKDIVSAYSSPFTLLNKKRPVEIGCSVSHRLNQITGTLGCFVKALDDGNTYVLSNHHVLYNSDDIDDDFIIQPSSFDGGQPNDVIGLYKRSLAFNESDINYFDAAIAGPVSVDFDLNIPGKAQPVTKSILPENDLRVYKFGAITNRTVGKITSFVFNTRVAIDGRNYDFEKQIRIQGYDEDFNNPAPFAAEGDSGSLVIDNESGAAVGLLFAGNKHGIGLANPIEPVLNGLNVAF